MPRLVKISFRFIFSDFLTKIDFEVPTANKQRKILEKWSVKKLLVIRANMNKILLALSTSTGPYLKILIKIMKFLHFIGK